MSDWQKTPLIGVWTLTKKFRFEASHMLKNHDGKCARLHGHSWKGRVIISSTNLMEGGAKDGMVEDFAGLSATVKPLVEQYLDHHHLNDSLQMDAPTCERVAEWLYRQVEPVLGKLLLAVEIDETCTSSCRYEELL